MLRAASRCLPSTLGRVRLGAESKATPSRRRLSPPTSSPADVIPGIEVLLSDSMHLIRGKRVGLITNHSGRDRRGTSTIDLLYKAPGVRLTALFGPEHGLRGVAKAGERIVSDVDSATGHSDLLAVRPDAGCPTPTCSRTSMCCSTTFRMSALACTRTSGRWRSWRTRRRSHSSCSIGRIPIRGDHVEGGVLDPKFRSFVGQYPVALRYGFTPGELLQVPRRHRPGDGRRHGRANEELAAVNVVGGHRASVGRIRRRTCATWTPRSSTPGRCSSRERTRRKGGDRQVPFKADRREVVDGCGRDRGAS